jgi:vacuolar protein sorting-associated protein 54
MTHQDFLALLRSILQGFWDCIEGLQALNGNITAVIEDTRYVFLAYPTTGRSLRSCRPAALPSELTAIRDSLFDTLSSTAESTNVLTSKVLSARADQHVKSELREFVEIFNECWSFVVRCEVTCKRMIVGLRGVVISQVRVGQVLGALADSLE